VPASASAGGEHTGTISVPPTLPTWKHWEPPEQVPVGQNGWQVPLEAPETAGKQ
jgi:hypothetical protein